MFKFYYKVILQLLFFIITISSIHAKNLEKFHKGSVVSDYFSGILSLSDNEYVNSYNFLKRLEGLEEYHYTFSKAYIYSLINLNKFNEGYKYSKKLEKKNLDSYESDLIIGIYYLKNKQNKLAKKYFNKLYERGRKNPLQNLISRSLLNWADVENLDINSAKEKFNFLDANFKNIKYIQNAFLNCYYNNSETQSTFENLTSNKSIDFSRYNFFYAKYLNSVNKKDYAIKVIDRTLNIYPRNLLLRQLKLDLNFKKKNNFKDNFDCRNISHNLAEIFYIVSNALSNQSIPSISNFYLNIARYLNKNFTSYDILYAENIHLINNLEKTKDIYLKIKSKGNIYNWYAAKQISSILKEQKKKKDALVFLSNAFNKITEPSVYEIFDYALFLKNNEKYEEAIKYYSQVLNLISKEHNLFAAATDGRGIAFERTGNWEKAEKDFLSSLSISPNQPYVINYLAYSWIEKGIKIEQSLEMLKKANNLRKNDGYIIDSLGWALFKLKKYIQAEEYLQQAVILMPSDPIVNDHYGDSLWMRGRKIQARYYWNYVLNLEDTKNQLKTEIKNKLINGLRINL